MHLNTFETDLVVCCNPKKKKCNKAVPVNIFIPFNAKTYDQPEELLSCT